MQYHFVVSMAKCGAILPFPTAVYHPNADMSDDLSYFSGFLTAPYSFIRYTQSAATDAAAPTVYETV